MVEEINDVIERHPAFDLRRVARTVVSNGTMFSQRIADFLPEP